MNCAWSYNGSTQPIRQKMSFDVSTSKLDLEKWNFVVVT